MRIDELIIAIQKRRESKQSEVFATPPQSYEEFVKRQGVWIGLGEALSIIEDARKRDEDD